MADRIVPKRLKKKSSAADLKQRMAQELRRLNARTLAQAHGGVLLSPTVPKYTCMLKWKCAKGHVWKATFRSTDSGGHWCPLCPELDFDQILKVMAKQGELLKEASKAREKEEHAHRESRKGTDILYGVNIKLPEESKQRQ